MRFTDEDFSHVRQPFLIRNRRRIQLLIIIIFIFLIVKLIPSFSKDENINPNDVNNSNKSKPDKNETHESDKKSNLDPDKNIPIPQKNPDIDEFKLNLKIFDPSSPAKCLDGSPYGVYFSRGYNEGAKKVIINFWGGGWCLGRNQSSILDSCTSRLNTADGSSRYFKSEYSHSYDFFDKDESRNKYFFNWNNFDVPYCDGTGAQGRRNSPTFSEKNIGYHFRGYDNTIAAFDYLFTKVHPKDLDTIVLFGCSSGGYTVMLWLQYIADYVKEMNPNTVVLGINNGGFFVDYKNINTNDNEFGIKIKAMHQFVNEESPVLNKDCVKENSENPHLCLLPEVLVKYIKAPLLLFQAAYDGWSVKNILGEECHYQDYTFKKCDESKIEKIKEYKDHCKNLMQEATKLKKNLSVLSPACIFHCFYHSFRDSNSFSVDGKTINNVINEFLNSKGEKQILLFDNFERPEERQCMF